MDYLNSVLIIGSGAREHAIVKAFLRCDRPLCMFAYSGNPGMENDGCTIISSPINDWTDLAEWALLNEIDLTVVGPEIPLVDGITDIFKKKNLKIFGPSQKASQLEGSKVFAKEIMEKYKIPTAAFKTFSDIQSASLYVKKQAGPVVVKVNGLAAGKGVYVCETAEEAYVALSDVFENKIFGEAGTTIVIEEKMVGEEASVFVLTDGDTYKILPISQDHKRAFDGDKGPNTGGMGAYAPCLLTDAAMIGRIEKEIISPTLEGMKNEGIPYSGLLYIGIMITSSGPKVVEFNCRFGDPEAQVVLPLTECDWYDAFMACTAKHGELSSVKLSVKKGFSVAVALTSSGYPGKYEKGKLITGIEGVEKKYVNVDVYHAGTKINENGKLVTNGGRVLTVSAVSETLKGAIASAYEAAEKIKFEGKTFRSDIAAKGLLKLKK